MSEHPGATPPGWDADPRSGGVGGAGVGVRFGARFLDGLIIGIPLSIILAAVGLGFTEGTGAQFLNGVISSVVIVAYYTLMESASGQTLGKRILNLRTVGPNGQVPTQEQAFKRNAWYLIGIVPLLGGLVTLAIAIWIAVAISQSGRGPHDGWAGGTTVVRTN